MMTNKQPQYDETFKKNIVALHQNGKTQTELSKEYGISVSAISRWIKLYSEVKVDDNTIMTAKQIKELQKRNAQLEESHGKMSIGKKVEKRLYFCKKRQKSQLPIKPAIKIFLTG